MRKRKILTLTISGVLAISSLGLTSCGKEDKNEKVKTVNIGTMDLVNGDLIAQYEKLYEEELGVDVNIVNFDSGRDVNTAFESGSIDISEVGTGNFK